MMKGKTAKNITLYDEGKDGKEQNPILERERRQNISLSGNQKKKLKKKKKTLTHVIVNCYRNSQ